MLVLKYNQDTDRFVMLPDTEYHALTVYELCRLGKFHDAGRCPICNKHISKKGIGWFDCIIDRSNHYATEHNWRPVFSPVNQSVPEGYDKGDHDE